MRSSGLNTLTEHYRQGEFPSSDGEKGVPALKESPCPSPRLPSPPPPRKASPASPHVFFPRVLKFYLVLHPHLCFVLLAAYRKLRDSLYLLHFFLLLA